MDFVIPLLTLLFIGIMYVIMLRINQGNAGFILLAIASGLMIYWIRELKLMSKSEDARNTPREVEQKDWVYDLIKNDGGEVIFVAEVPGPEDQIDVRLVTGVLQIKGGQNFAKNIPLNLSVDMGISDYKYRNGVLTIKIRRA